MQPIPMLARMRAKGNGTVPASSQISIPSCMSRISAPRWFAMVRRPDGQALRRRVGERVNGQSVVQIRSKEAAIRDRKHKVAIKKSNPIGIGKSGKAGRANHVSSGAKKIVSSLRNDCQLRRSILVCSHRDHARAANSRARAWRRIAAVVEKANSRSSQPHRGPLST